MIPISNELKQAFEQGIFCVLIRITTKLGQVFGYTDYAMQLEYDGTMFVPGPDMIRMRNYQTSASSSNSQKVKLVRLGDFTSEELESGLFDDATVEVMRVVPQSLHLGHFVVSHENISAAKWDDNVLEFDVLDMFRGMTETIGTDNSPNCRHTFGDTFSPAKAGACTLNANDYTSSLVVTQVNSRLEFEVNSDKAAGWFANGNIVWTLGYNSSGENTIKSHVVEDGRHKLTLFIPETFNISVGDQLKVVVGCDGTFDTCNGKFANGRHFGGNPILNPGITQR